MHISVSGAVCAGLFESHGNFGGQSRRYTTFYLGPDRDIEGDDLASQQIENVIGAAEADDLFVDRKDVEEALADYRRSRGQTM